ncbi:MAG: RES family NAD+ phosphorylase [Gammaproteobacteria bacterium]
MEKYKEIWKACQGQQHIQKLRVSAWRITDQDKMTIRKLVDSEDDYQILADLIEQVRPSEELRLKPFRAPYLHRGSRFAHRSEPSLWYGSLDLDAAFAEAAFYRLLFLSHSTTLNVIEISLVVFSVFIETQQGIDLTQSPFNRYKNIISSPVSYAASQSLGSAMRLAGVMAFLYYCARTHEQKHNVALFTPQGFSNKEESALQLWQCIANDKGVSFIRQDSLSNVVKVYPAAYFMIDGQIIPPQ